MKIIFTFILFQINKNYSLIKNKRLFAEPDLNVKEIDEKWRHLCGYRFIPFERHIKFNSKCFGSERVINITENYKLDEKSAYYHRIIHGIGAEQNESPWTVQFARREKLLGFNLGTIQPKCTGVLITMRHILTSAHCAP